MIQSVVYLVHAVGTSRYKIGYSTNVKARLQGMGTDCPYPVELVATVRATKQIEKRLHQWLEDYRAHREWFVLPLSTVCRLREVFDGKRPVPTFLSIAQNSAEAI